MAQVISMQAVRTARADAQFSERCAAFEAEMNNPYLRDSMDRRLLKRAEWNNTYAAQNPGDSFVPYPEQAELSKRLLAAKTPLRLV